MEWLGVDRHRLGTAMLAFGLIGLVLAAVVGAALVAGGMAARDLDEQIAVAQERLGASLTRLTLTIDSIAMSTDDTGTTLATSRDGVVHAADALNDVASTADSLATALDITIVGEQPFTGAVSELRSLEARVRVFQNDAIMLAANLDQNVDDVTQIARDIRDMRSQFAELTGAFSSFANVRGVASFAVGGIALAGLLTLWQAILSIAIAWAGLRLRRHVAAQSTPVGDSAAAPPPPGEPANP